MTGDRDSRVRYRTYLADFIGQLWGYADTHKLRSLLTQPQRISDRPPEFKRIFDDKNILLPPTASRDIARRISRLLPRDRRHRYFGSMRSSQALALSVFGGLCSLGKMGLLEGLEDDDGRQAFPSQIADYEVTLDKPIYWLGEPRPTQIDVWLQGEFRVAVECKLTERTFGTCSRPTLRPTDSNYERDHCDGSYTRQIGRTARCSLAQQNIKYWEYVPQVFTWGNQRDLMPCPMANTYQLVRNLLTGCISPAGSAEPETGYTLIIYDERNPFFHSDYEAGYQLKSVYAALRYPAILRRCSWQKLAAHMSSDLDLDWLVEGLQEKYGIK